MKILLILLLSSIVLNHVNCKISASDAKISTKNELLSSGKKLQSSTTDTSGLKTSDTQKTQQKNSPPTNQESEQQQAEEQTADQRTQTLAASFVTPINTINTLYKNIDTVDKKLKQDIKKRTVKNRFAPTKDLITNAQTKKTTTYIKIITSIQQLLNDTESLPTRTELQQSLYRNAALKLGTVIQALINNLCEQPKKTTKMVIKKDYKNAIQQADFLAMITKAAEFSRGFNNQQNTRIKRALTMLAKSKLPTISK